VGTDVTVDSDLYLTATGMIPLPANAIPLELLSTIRSEHFRARLQLTVDAEGRLLAASLSNNVIAEFSCLGAPGRLWDGGPSQKGWLRSPAVVAADANRLIVHEWDGSSRSATRYFLHEFHPDKQTIRRREVPKLHDLAAGTSGSVISAPVVRNSEDPLIRIDVPDGPARTFGKPLPYRHSLAELNRRQLAVSEKGDIYVAFTHFPLVRKYAPDGVLLGEYRVDNPVFEAKERINLKLIGQGYAGPDLQGGYKEIITDIDVRGDRIYLLSCHPCLEVTELDEEGRSLATYWMDSREVYTAHSLAVADCGEERRFFISHTVPPKSEIDIFRKSNRIFSEGLPGEIERWTAEIENDPGYAMAYHNRGVARYQSGDFPGAIEDLTKTIEMTPGSASAYYNRGLAEVKTGRYDDAVRDFSKVIELQPSAASFFNRGIARVHLRFYEQAIPDFENAAERDPAFKSKSLEQITYCRKRLKKQETQYRHN
jgi:hypothetical protein